MRITRIYSDIELKTGSKAQLDEKASHHLAKVLRQRVGAELILFNGSGVEYQATILSIDKKQVTVEVGEATSPATESPLNVHLGISISKGDRFDWVLQKSTELGVNIITPLISERSEFKLQGERLDKKLSHWRQILISACEQCGRNIIPVLNEPCGVESWTSSVEADMKYVLHHRTSQSLNAREKPDSIALLVGPEGGLSATEIQLAEQRGFDALALGPRVLRTETAPIAALAVLQSTWGDF